MKPKFVLFDIDLQAHIMLLCVFIFLFLFLYIAVNLICDFTASLKFLVSMPIILLLFIVLSVKKEDIFRKWLFARLRDRLAVSWNGLSYKKNHYSFYQIFNQKNYQLRIEKWKNNSIQSIIRNCSLVVIKYQDLYRIYYF
jgi:hypothetical protein